MKKVIIFSFAALLLIACEKDEATEPATDPNNSNTGSTTTSLAPTGIVSTHSGSTKGLSDGIGIAAQYQFANGIFSSSTHLYAAHAGKYSFITRRSPFVIRKIDLLNDSVTTLVEITENIFDNVNGDKAKAATIVPIGDSLYLGYGYRLFIIHNSNGNYRSTRLPATTDNFGHLFIYNGRLMGLEGNKLSEINKIDGTKTTLYSLDATKINPNVRVQGISLIGDELYISTDNARLDPNSDDYELYSVNLINQTVDYIITQSEAATYGYGFDQISTDGTDIYYTSDGRNSATYTFGKIDLGTKKNYLIGAKNSGYNDGTLDTSEFWIPVGHTFVQGDMYIFDRGNNKVRKVEFD